MTTTTEAIHAILQAHVGLNALIADRIYSIVVPQDSVMPCVVTQKVGQLRENTMAQSGGNGVDNARTRITIYSDTLSECEAIAEQIRLCFESAESTDFNAVQIFNIDQFDNDTQLYQVIVDYSVWYRH